MLKAPICWMGGKSKLRKEIISRLPEHHCYVEVFGGAGWVLFGKEPSFTEVYNDIDGDLTNFFRVIKNAHRAFVQAFDWILVSRRLFTDFVNTNPDDLDEIQRAVRFYYIIKTSYGGRWNSATFGFTKTGRSNLNTEDLYETITAVHHRLRRVYIEEGSFENIILRYDSESTVFFLDPPYYGTAEYIHKMLPSDYSKLKEMLTEIKGKFLLTINDCDYTRQQWGSFSIEKVEVPYSIGRDKQSRVRYGELIVTNYK